MPSIPVDDLCSRMFDGERLNAPSFTLNVVKWGYRFFFLFFLFPPPPSFFVHVCMCVQRVIRKKVFDAVFSMQVQVKWSIQDFWSKEKKKKNWKNEVTKVEKVLFLHSVLLAFVQHVTSQLDLIMIIILLIFSSVFGFIYFLSFWFCEHCHAWNLQACCSQISC